MFSLLNYYTLLNTLFTYPWQTATLEGPEPSSCVSKARTEVHPLLTSHVATLQTQATGLYASAYCLTLISGL